MVATRAGMLLQIADDAGCQLLGMVLDHRHEPRGEHDCLLMPQTRLPLIRCTVLSSRPSGRYFHSTHAVASDQSPPWTSGGRARPAPTRHPRSGWRDSHFSWLADGPAS